jgi:uncharacterized OsmC-like protein
VGACLCASLRYCLHKANVAGTDVKADVHVELVRNQQRRLRVGRIEVRLHPGAGVDPAALSSCLVSFEDFCVVTESVRQGIDVQVQLESEAPPRQAAPAGGGDLLPGSSGA